MYIIIILYLELSGKLTMQKRQLNLHYYMARLSTGQALRPAEYTWLSHDLTSRSNKLEEGSDLDIHTTEPGHGSVVNWWITKKS